MRKLIYIVAILLLIITSAVLFILNRNKNNTSGIEIIHPFNDARFPPEFPAPLFQWWTTEPGPTSFEISLSSSKKNHVIRKVTTQTEWTPDEQSWDNLKVLSDLGRIYFEVRKKGDKKSARIEFGFSRDSVGAPVVYREMPIPFIIAEKQLDSMNFMLIDFGSKQKPHIAMRGFPVCGNCHSFSAGGELMGLDLDAGLRDKGGYFVSEVEDTLYFSPANYTSWSRLEKRRTFGLFSKLSPDGRYIVTTVKDRVVMKNFPVNPVENVKYSQLFFPVNGHLAVYDRQTGIFRELPGADLDEYVQSNAIWTPDGKNIIFSRAPALPMGEDKYEIDVQDQELVNEFVERKRTFKYDLYMIPFNEGNGGTAVPVEGASNNGKSNYFPAISPDGKWIIYCQAENFMLLMPDSRLYIIPATGGKARALACNFNSMNSWHAWSPNSKWIVYASKIFGPYTDMFLSHIDEKGNASIPVLVDKARVPARVINYPEFLNRKPGDTFVMRYDFVELAHINRAVTSGEIDKAKALYTQFLEQDPFLFSEDCRDLSFLLNKMGMPEEAEKYEELAKHTVNASVFQGNPH